GPFERSLLEPDVLVRDALPERWRFADGPRRLLLALLEDAVACLAQRGEGGREALAWFESGDLSWGSFLYLCDVLGFEAREQMRAYARGVAARRLTATRFHRRVRYRSRASPLRD